MAKYLNVIRFIMDIEYFNYKVLNEFDEEKRAQLSPNSRGKMIANNIRAFKHADDNLVIQKDIYKYKPYDMAGELIEQYDQTGEYNLRIVRSYWEQNYKPKGTPKDTTLPSMYFLIETDKPIDNTDLCQFLYCTEYFQEHKYYTGKNNGWTTYTDDGECIYAISRAIDVQITYSYFI